MAKFCVFCGNPPEHKNQEHIIPQWLIRYTARGKKAILTDNSTHTISFQNFTLPACEKCNLEFAKLEANTQQIMIKVLTGQPITGMDASVLMDWFDKVRVGLWLAQLCLNPSIRIEPHMFISQRMGYQDRALMIQKEPAHPNMHGILLIGTQSPLFHGLPCAFQMVIDNYIFTNISSIRLVSKQLGFPYPNTITQQAPNQQMVNVLRGMGRVGNPAIPGFFPDKTRAIFYQPIFKSYLTESFTTNPYVVEHSYDIQNGLGGVFRHTTDGIKYIPADKNIYLKIQDTPLKQVRNASQVPFDLLEYASQLTLDPKSELNREFALYRAQNAQIHLKIEHQK